MNVARLLHMDVMRNERASLSLSVRLKCALLFPLRLQLSLSFPSLMKASFSLLVIRITILHFLLCTKCLLADVLKEKDAELRRERSCLAILSPINNAGPD